MEEEKKRRRDQYHPYVCAGLHIALEEDSPYLSFEEEHQLGTGSKSIDCLIIKKDSRVQIKKDIGRIFRGHNLVEIKGYRDYLSIDKFYRALGYAFFYKADAKKENSIDIQDITLTFIIPGMPQKLIKHLKKIWGIEPDEKGDGIYYLKGFIIPVQLIVASELDEEENLLLKSLLMPVEGKEKINELLKVYRKHRDNGYYEKVINFIIEKEEKNIRRKENMGPELKKTLLDVFSGHLNSIASEMANEMASEMANEMASEMANEMASEMANEMASEMANEMAKEMAQKMAQKMADEKINEMAKRLLRKGISCEEVGECMELKLEKVEELQKELLHTV